MTVRTSRLGEAAGFSLFELVVVLILLAVAAAIVLPSFTTGLSGVELETAARDLVTRLKQARADAIGHQQVIRLVLENDEQLGAGYRLTDDFGQTMRAYPLPPGARFLFDHEGFAPDSIVALQISFYPNGRSSGGGFTLVSPTGRRVRVEIDPITGLGKVPKEPSRERGL